MSAISFCSTTKGYKSLHTRADTYNHPYGVVAPCLSRLRALFLVLVTSDDAITGAIRQIRHSHTLLIMHNLFLYYYYYIHTNARRNE